MIQMRKLHIALIVILAVCWLIQMIGTAVKEGSNNGHDLRRYWWAVILELIVLILNVFVLFKGVEEWHTALISLSTMASAYLMVIADGWLDMNKDGDMGAAGTILVIIINICVIVFVSNPTFRQQAQTKVSCSKEIPVLLHNTQLGKYSALMKLTHTPFFQNNLFRSRRWGTRSRRRRRT